MDRISLLGRTLPETFRLHVTLVPPGAACPFDESDWADALVVVEQGEIELECEDGTSTRFGTGAVLWLTGLPLVALHNRGFEPALLAAVSRA